MVERLSPEELLGLTAAALDERLDELEAGVPVRETLVELLAAHAKEAIVFGDTHGDWRTTRSVAAEFLTGPAERVLVGLGDYIDRAPRDCAEGSVVNSLYLLGLAAEFPDRVFLLQGNHETHRRIPVVPHDLPEELDDRWGPDPDRETRILALLERGPFAGYSRNGAYVAHAGFPRGDLGGSWQEAFDVTSESRLLDLVWADCAASRHHRGVGDPFTETDLDGFLARAGLRIFLRGHDPDLVGRPVFHGHCLTLHTSRVYERYGGVLYARVPMDRALGSVEDITIERAETQGKDFPVPW